MSEKIDKRIVEMSFENAKFEKGIHQSKNSLKDFTKALEESGSSRSFTGLNNSIGDVSSSFSAMSQIAIGALRRIGSEAVAAGAKLIKSLAVDPITQGFQELELKMDSTKTIMASTGETLEVVNEKLNELNHYSDRTIYSFSDMTQNIGKFTNAGVKLDMAVASIQGVANAAALAGANSNEASRAMYNFAQALSGGSVKLIDWKSIELANMATVEFKQELMDSAVAAGTLAKTADGMYSVLTTKAGSKGMAGPISATKNFNESLQEQWMTTEVLTETLSRYSDETTDIGRRAIRAATEVNTLSKLMDTLQESVGSGWAQTFELIFGDFEQSKKLWTGINDVLGAMIDKTSDVRNALLKGGLGEFVEGQMTGRENIIQGLKNAVIGLLEAIKPISEAWDQIFPPMAVERLYKITESFKNFTSQLRISEETANKLKRTFAGVFAGFDILREAFRFVLRGALEVINIFIPLGDSILGITANIGDLVVGLRNAIKNSQVFAYGLLAIKIGALVLRNVLLSAYIAVKAFITGLIESGNPLEYLLGLFGKVGTALGNIIKWIQGKLTFIIQKIGEFFGLFKKDNVNAIQSVSEFFKTLGTNISNFVLPAFQKLKDILSKITFEKIISFVIGATLLTLVWQLSRAAGGFANLTESVGDFLKALSKNLRKNRTFRDLAISLGVLTASIWVLSKIPAEDIYRSLARIAIGLGMLIGAFAAIKAIDNKLPSLDGKGKKNTLSSQLLSIGAGLLSMVAVVAILGNIKTSTITKALPNLALLTAILVGIEVLFGLVARIGKGSTVSVKLTSLTASLLGMTALVGILSIIPENTINKGLKSLLKLVGVITAIQIITAVAARISGGTVFKQSLGSIVLAMTAMVGLIAVLSSFTDEQFNRGFSSLKKIVGIIAMFQVISTLSNKFGGTAKTSLSQMIGITAIIIALTASLAILSLADQTALSNAADSFSKVIIATGIFASGIGILLIYISKMNGTSIKLMGIIKGLIPSLLAITAIFGAMVLFFKAAKFLLNDIRDLSWSDLGKLGAGLVVVGALFAAIALLKTPLMALGAGIIPALLGALGVIAVIGLVVAAFIGLAWVMNQLDADALANGFEKLASVGSGIGKFFGSILGGFSEGTLEGAGRGLASLCESLEDINPESVSVIKDLADAFFKMSFTRAAGVKTFAQQLSFLITELSAIQTSDIVRAIGALNLMALMTDGLGVLSAAAEKISNSGLSLLSITFGDNKLDDFAEQLSGMVFAINTIPTSDIVRAIGALNNIALMIDSLTELSTFSKTLENSGGLSQLGTGNTTLDEFGKQISGFVLAFNLVEKKDVTNAFGTVRGVGTMIESLTALSALNNGLKASGGLDQVVKGNTTLDEFGKQIKNLVVNLAKIKKTEIDTAKNNIGAVSEMLENLKTLSVVNPELAPTSTNTYILSIGKLLTAAKNKILSYSDAFYNAGATLVENLRLPFEEELTSYEGIGEWIPKSIDSGIKKGTPLIINAGIKMAEDLEEGIRDTTGVHSESDIFKQIGEWITKSLGNGLDGPKGWLLEKAEAFGIDTSKITLDGISETIGGGEGIVTQGIQALLDKLMGKEGGDILGEGFAKGFQDAITNATSGIGGTETVDKVKTELEKLQDYIEEEKYYGRMSLREELDEYLKIQAKYVVGSEERKKIDREVYRLQKTIYESQKKYIEDNLKAKKEAAEKSLDLEVDFKNNVNQLEKEREAEHTRIVKDAEDRRQKIREDYAAKQQTINDNLRNDIKSIYESYIQRVDSRTDTIVGSYGLFDEIPESESVSGDALLNNLKDQVLAIEDWDKALTDLASRGVGDALIEELQKMGPSASTQIKALLSLSDTQLNEYVELYGNKYALARTRAESELILMKEAIPEILQDLRINAKRELSDIRESFDKSMTDIDTQMYGDLLMLNTNVDLQLDDLCKSFRESIDEINVDLKENLSEMKSTFDTAMSEIEGLTIEELEELNRQFEDQITELNNNLEANLGTTETLFSETGRQINEQANTTLTTLKEIYSTGSKAVANLAQGILEGLPSAGEAAKSLVEVVLDQLSAMIERFRGIGIESAEAYVAGLRESGNINISNVPNANLSSEIFAGINSDLVKANSVSAANISSSMTPKDDTISQNGSGKVVEIKYTQNNNSPKALSRLDIYRATNTQLATLKEAVSRL